MQKRRYNSYTTEQLDKSLELYKQGRAPDKNSRGDYTLNQIAEITGVHYASVFKHANPAGAGL